MNFKSLSKESIFHFTVFGLLLFALNYLTNPKVIKKKIFITEDEVNVLANTFQNRNSKNIDPSLLKVLIELEIYSKILKKEKIHTKYISDLTNNKSFINDLIKKRKTEYSVRVEWPLWKNNKHSL